MNRLRELRLQRKLASWGLSVKSQVSTSTISAIERWDYVPRRETQKRIADALDVDASAIWPDQVADSSSREAGRGK